MSNLESETEFPLIVSAGLNKHLLSHIESHFTSLDDILSRHGAILFRGFEMNSASGFQEFVDSLGVENLEYTYRSTPRRNLARNVFTATEYPASLEIPLHCENSYQARWPLWLAFYCHVPPESGGQTTIADMRAVSKTIRSDIFRKFANIGVKYIRNYHPRIDLSWQEVFQTSEPQAVESYCISNMIKFAWGAGNVLRTEHTCQGVSPHPITDDIVFFNQAHLFHPSSLGEENYEDILCLFDAENLPRNVKFGDGSDISREELENIRAAFQINCREIQWQRGDVAILDNMLTAHGRRPFSGRRQLLVSLLKPSTVTYCPLP